MLLDSGVDTSPARPMAQHPRSGTRRSQIFTGPLASDLRSTHRCQGWKPDTNFINLNLWGALVSKRFPRADDKSPPRVCGAVISAPLG